MGGLSSNSIVHMTKCFNNLKNILIDSYFRPKYCTEVIETKEVQKNDSLTLAVPMVSFCDIPLSQIKNHIEKYGDYGIGLSKEWANSNGLNPVLYFSRESHIINSIHQIIYDKNEDVNTFVLNVLNYSKNYEGYIYEYCDGEIEVSKNKSDVYRFSDEREWRYVDSSGFKYIEDYWENKNKYNNEINGKLKFSYKDIRYIIIKADYEIKDILKIISDVHESDSIKQILTTRILTVSQIQSDF